MKKLQLLGMACALAAGIAGCGPMKSPMPERFDPESQTKIDEGWNRLFTPLNRYAHQELLDVMVGVQAYQLGIDSLHLRSEKRFAGGKVVMEVAFDRAKPDEDRFEVTILDSTGKTIRNERYTRKEVNETYQELFVNLPPAHDPKAPDHEARWKHIAEIFPQPQEDDAPQR